MAIAFNKTKGGAQKSSISSFAYRDGDNKVRLVGDILARYVYWIQGENGKNIPFECLSLFVGHSLPKGRVGETECFKGVLRLRALEKSLTK